MDTLLKLKIIVGRIKSEEILWKETAARSYAQTVMAQSIRTTAVSCANICKDHREEIEALIKEIENATPE